MPLFHPKIIDRQLGNIATIPANHLEILQQWKSRIEDGGLDKQNEVAIHAPFTQNIMVDVLGYQLFGSSGQWTISREYGVASGAVDLALGHFSDDKESDQVVAPFELKGAKTKNLDAIMPGRHKTPVQQAWDYARDIKGAEWVLVSNYLQVRLYVVSETSLVYEQFDLAQLTSPAAYERFILLLHADNLLSGKTTQLLQQSLQADKEITARLYSDYKNLRTHLTTQLISDNPNHSPSELIAPAQKLLDRFLFIAFAEDKRLIPENTIQQAFEHNDPYNPRPIYDNFKGLFRAIDLGNASLKIPAYNGGLFAPDPLLDQLIVDDTSCQQVNELAKYDFDSEVSVTVLGHIFEQSIADLETLSEQISSGDLSAKSTTTNRAVSGKRKQHGVVYTPDNITAFIVEQTLGSQIERRFQQLLGEYGSLKKEGTIQWKRGKQTELRFWYAWQEALRTIKIVDPACGSGAFLVAAFDHLHAAYQRTNDKLAELTGQHSILDLNKEILNNNLFGVDINPESIEISKLSLWLKTAEVGKPLTSLDTNLLTGNSLALEAPTPDSGNGFSWQTAFPDILNQGGFDVVLGNPPYVRQERFSNLKPWLEQHYSVYHGVTDLYSYFFELGHKLLKADGRMGYISSSTFFKTGSGEPLRRYLSQQTTLEKIIDFGDLQIFEGVTTYPAIVILQQQPAKPEHPIQILPLKDQLPENLNQEFTQSSGTMRQHQLSEASWQLENEALYQLRKKLTDGYPTLKEVYGSPYRGVLTGLNAAFVINTETHDQLISEDPQSSELLKPFLEGKDLKKWHAEPRGLWLIAIPKLWTRKQTQPAEGEDLTEEVAWEWLSSHYPAIAKWLAPFAEKGRKRTDKGEFWWELRACAYYAKFSELKIFYPDITDSPKFHHDTSGSFSANTGYFISTDTPHIVALLSSTVIWFLLTGISDAVRGGFYRMFSQNINQLPIPTASGPQQEAISNLAKSIQRLTEQCYTVQQNFRRRLPDLCPPDRESKLNKKMQQWWLLDFTELQKVIKSQFKTTIPLAERNDWEDYFNSEKKNISAHQLRIKNLENELNNAIYTLFNLTQKEIILIQQNNNPPP